MKSKQKYWAVIPAAGIGSRMESAIPKQYLSLAGKTVIEHTLEKMASLPYIEAIVVAIAENDEQWASTQKPENAEIITVTGGRERHHSVLNALQQLMAMGSPDDWVLVHDAARPCVRCSDIDKLLSTVEGHEIGGLLGLPVSDTMKRTDKNFLVTETINREGLWRALTPQIFRLGALLEAIQSASNKGKHITDEASAMEMQGHQPIMVEGHADNIKITSPQDLILSEQYIQLQETLSTP